MRLTVSFNPDSVANLTEMTKLIAKLREMAKDEIYKDLQRTENCEES